MLALLISQLDDDDRMCALDLYNNYYHLAHKIIFSITHSNNDIEDLINEVFIKLIEKIALLRSLDRYKVTSYIVYTARSVSINYLKHRDVENKHIYFSDDMEENGVSNELENDFDNKLIWQEDMESLKNAICKLPQNQKDLLYFKYILEMSDDEIANVLGIAPNSIRQYLTRARRNAKAFIDRGVCNDVK